MQDDLSLHLDQVRASEAAQQAFRDREAARHSGVAWSGLAPPPLRQRAEAELIAAAGARQRAAQAWRDRPEGAFLTAIAAIQRAAARLHAYAEQTRAAATRGLAGEQAACAALLRDVHAQALEIDAHLRLARNALDRPL